MAETNMMNKNELTIGLVRAFILLRHPRLSYWYWKNDRQRRLPNPAAPQTMNDKFFWRKVFDRNPEFTEVSDKIAVRRWLEEKKIPVQSPQILWVGTEAADIPDKLLENGAAVKANHGSGTNMILHSKPVDRKAFNRRVNRFLKKPQGRKRMEWGYFGIDRSLMVEELIPNVTAEFKLYTFGDRIERLVTIFDRFGEMEADVWLPSQGDGWEKFEGEAAVSSRRGNKELPKTIEVAVSVAREIGGHFDHMRVDILTDGEKLWFSELTVYNMAGFHPTLGDDPKDPMNISWDIKKSWFMNSMHRGWRRLYCKAIWAQIG